LQIGPLIVDIDSVQLTEEESDYLKHPFVGGVILFSKNYSCIDELVTLIKQIKSLRYPSLLIFVDQEGGRVQRFRNGFTELPALGSLGSYYEGDLQKVAGIVRECGWIMATEMKAIGVDVSFAPVLDTFNEESEIIGDRSFHSDPNVICALATIYVSAMNSCGMHAVGKHFPGHGAVTTDSHIELPVDNRTIDAVDQADLIPFKFMASVGISGFMVAHIIFPRVDHTSLAGFSNYWLQKILREKVGFNGVIFSDDLSMEGAAVSSSYFTRANLALSAGCDALIVCNNKDGIFEILDKYSKLQTPSCMKSLEMIRGPSCEIPHDVLRSTSLWKIAAGHIAEFISKSAG